MSDWKRNTKEIAFESLPPDLASAVSRHLEQYNLGPIIADALMCIQTDSEKVKRGLFGSAKTVQLAAIITPRWLVWVFSEAKTKPTALSAQLINVTIQDYAQTPFVKLVADSGIEVRGVFTDASESVSAFIGLDEGAAGKKFREIVIKTAQDARK